MAFIRLDKVSISIPVHDVATASLKKAIIGRAIGGRFRDDARHVFVNALKDISFEAKDGDRIGLIGINGSGKSTLLRVLSEVYPPSQGTVEIEGRISPMFEMTLGMEGEATGYENIYISGALWGLTRKEIDESMDDILSFTELGQYLAMPLRTYSSGMQLRLAFAIATLRQPDILLLDEVIGVGDVSFFQKAYARLKDLVDRSRILFLASHSPHAIQDLCNKVIWLHSGTMIEYGDADAVLKAYHEKNG